MKLIHLSDLHLGKRVNEFSMLEDQAFILDKIAAIIAEERPQGVLIAGDVYDKTVPPAEAVALFDAFLCRLSALQVQVYIISGNHDSAERLSFGGRLMDQSGVHFCPVYDGTVTPYTLTDEYGPVHLYLLPFLKPAHLRRYFPEATIDSYTDAIGVAVEAMGVDTTHRNLLVTHQFVTGATRSESEEISVGGSDNVDAEVFAPFDYVALGHIHGPQQVGRETVRYCGTPLKYAFSEAAHQKSVTVVELKEKGQVTIRTVPLTPLRDMQKLRGTYAALTLKENWEKTDCLAYTHITLTDEEDIPDAVGKLRVIYPHLMGLSYDNTRTRLNGRVGAAQDVRQRSPLTLFGEFYEKQNNQPLSEAQTAYLTGLIAGIWEGEQ